VLMGLGRAEAIACQLIDRGWSRGTPAAIVADATRPQQQVWRGTLDDLARETADVDGDGPGTLVIGDVVAIGMRIGKKEAIESAASRRSATLFRRRSSYGGPAVALAKAGTVAKVRG